MRLPRLGSPRSSTMSTPLAWGPLLSGLAARTLSMRRLSISLRILRARPNQPPIKRHKQIQVWVVHEMRCGLRKYRPDEGLRPFPGEEEREAEEAHQDAD